MKWLRAGIFKQYVHLFKMAGLPLLLSMFLESQIYWKPYHKKILYFDKCAQNSNLSEFINWWAC